MKQTITNEHIEEAKKTHKRLRVATLLIPDSVVAVGERAFEHNPNLASVLIGKNVTTVGSGAFDTYHRRCKS